MKEVYDFSQGRRGAIDPLPPGKSRITIRLDNGVIEWFGVQVENAGGGNYQTLINQALREYIWQNQEAWEDTLRHVIREELRPTIQEAVVK
ncbi:MAG: CopG family transcriptional regulator [Chloroflexi bacterium]|nr:BrnA antitoxin family protein [Ardenticatenaceae bacterium]MBL1129983.1 CopG family transcriptional regulator [Chloroflexota bacterium]NOG36069.1 CopG family transcriptional regulator [Chloroflexota bacterium]GIK58987.1 MAG: hypothetical protein BroJett015_46500 [Chloroflexota bacterium]